MPVNERHLTLNFALVIGNSYSACDATSWETQTIYDGNIYVSLLRF